MILRIVKRLGIKWNGLVIGETYTKSWHVYDGETWSSRHETFVHKGRKVTFPLNSDANQLESGPRAVGWVKE